jgi:hypothetical protein
MKSITLTNILLLVVLALAIIAIILFAKVVLLSINTPTINKKMVLNDIDNAKPSHSALIVISFLAGLTIVINLINGVYNNMKTANVILIISMILIIVVSVFGMINFSRLQLDKDTGASASFGPLNIKAGSKAPILIESFTYLAFIMAIIVSCVNGNIAVNFFMKKQK